MMYAKEEEKGLMLSSTQVSQDWVEVTSFPKSTNFRDTWYLDGSKVLESTEEVEAMLAAASLQKAKEAKTAALDNLVYDFGDGRIMQTRPKDEANILRVVEVLRKHDIPTVNWIMLDNVKYPTTAEELEVAREAGILAGMQIWDDYAP